MDGTCALWPPEAKTATGNGHLLLVRIHVPKVVETQPRAYLMQCLHLHPLPPCKMGHPIDVNLLIANWLLVMACYHTATYQYYSRRIFSFTVQTPMLSVRVLLVLLRAPSAFQLRCRYDGLALIKHHIARKACGGSGMGTQSHDRGHYNARIAKTRALAKMAATGHCFE